MRKLVVALVGVALMAGCASEKVTLKDQKEKVSYSIGLNIGNNLKAESIEVDPSVIAKGIKDAMAGGKLLMTEKEVQETMTAFQKEMMVKHMEKAKMAGEKGKKEGEAFLAENKKKEGVKTLPDGLQYKIIKEGTGKMPKATDIVTVNYRGTLIDGTEFDSSYKRGQPASFPVNGVIPGWTEALQMMKVGSKWQLFIPSNIAYGEQGSPPVIGPNATLIFEVELLGIK